MQIITGKHRHAYEFLIAQAAYDAAQTLLLKDRVSQLEKMLAREQQRADNAVDELLATKGMAPVSPPPTQVPMPDVGPFEEDPAEIDKWRKVIADNGLSTAIDEAKNA